MSEVNLYNKKYIHTHEFFLLTSNHLAIINDLSIMCEGKFQESNLREFREFHDLFLYTSIFADKISSLKLIFRIFFSRETFPASFYTCYSFPKISLGRFPRQKAAS